MKDYAKMRFTEREFALLRGGLSSLQDIARARGATAIANDEKKFYSGIVAEYIALKLKFDAVLESDRSQDAEPDDEEEEEE